LLFQLVVHGKLGGSKDRYIWETLFRSLAKDNGIDPETFINSLGGEPSFSDCEQSAQQFNS
jgi:hypothetical protein